MCVEVWERRNKIGIKNWSDVAMNKLKQTGKRRAMHGATMEEDGLQLGGGVLENIDFESWGVPAPDSLYLRRRRTSSCERCCPAGLHRVTADCLREKSMKPIRKPAPPRWCPVRFGP